MPLIVLFMHRSFGIRDADPNSWKNNKDLRFLIKQSSYATRDYVPMFSILKHTAYVPVSTVYLVQ